jgi:hypothetical protein
MPCNSGPSLREVKNNLENDNKLLRKRLDLMTDGFCALYSFIEEEQPNTLRRACVKYPQLKELYLSHLAEDKQNINSQLKELMDCVENANSQYLLRDWISQIDNIKKDWQKRLRVVKEEKE